MAYPLNLREEELKNKVAQDYYAVRKCIEADWVTTQRPGGNVIPCRGPQFGGFTRWPGPGRYFVGRVMIKYGVAAWGRPDRSSVSQTIRQALQA